MKSILLPLLLASSLTAPAATLVFAPDEDVMTSAFFSGMDLVRGYSGDGRNAHRVASDNAFNIGPETVYLSFDSQDFGTITDPLLSATISLTATPGGFGGDASSGSPFGVSAHGVNADPLASITDDTNPTGPTSFLDFFNNNILAAGASSTTAVDATSGIFEFDVTDLVNDWIAGTNPHQFIAMTGKNDPGTSDFLHGFLNNTENPGSTFLTITTVPEPSAALLAGLSLLPLLRRSRK